MIKKESLANQQSSSAGSATPLKAPELPSDHRRYSLRSGKSAGSSPIQELRSSSYTKVSNRERPGRAEVVRTSPYSLFKRLPTFDGEEPRHTRHHVFYAGNIDKGYGHASFRVGSESDPLLRPFPFR